MKRPKTSPATPAELSVLADRVEALLQSALEGFADKERLSAVYWSERNTALHSLKIVLEGELGATIKLAHDAARIRISGLSTSCTAGLEGAVRNWISAARRKATA